MEGWNTIPLPRSHILCIHFSQTAKEKHRIRPLEILWHIQTLNDVDSNRFLKSEAVSQIVWVLTVNGFSTLASNFIYICTVYYSKCNDINNKEAMQDSCYTIVFFYGVKLFYVQAQESSFIGFIV